MTRRVVPYAVALAALLTSAAGAQTGPNPLDGSWKLVSVIDEGKLVPVKNVSQTLIKDGRVEIRGQVISMQQPDGSARKMAFITNDEASPKTVDIAGTRKLGSKGVYSRDGDTLVICLRNSDSDTRPTELASRGGSDTIQMTFVRVKDAAPAAGTGTAPVPVAPRPAAPAAEVLRRKMVGTWGHQNSEVVVKTTFNPDGTYGTTVTYRKGLKKVFGSEERTSGRWLVKDATVTMTATASTEKKERGQVYSFRVESINDREMISIDNMSGGRFVKWKLR